MHEHMFISMPDKPNRPGICLYLEKGECNVYKILKKKPLNPTVTLMEIEAPLVAKKAEPVSLLFYVSMKRVSVSR